MACDGQLAAIGVEVELPAAAVGEPMPAAIELDQVLRMMIPPEGSRSQMVRL
ncbi:MAG: hypothetical protein M3252_08675 [Actinomycetota bacterium]|nr:hypothetical protein [Actinomycetota bacterium]